MPFIPNEIIAPAVNTYIRVGVRQDPFAGPDDIVDRRFDAVAQWSVERVACSTEAGPPPDVQRKAEPNGGAERSSVELRVSPVGSVNAEGCRSAGRQPDQRAQEPAHHGVEPNAHTP
jgi:hypothetical protein